MRSTKARAWFYLICLSFFRIIKSNFCHKLGNQIWCVRVVYLNENSSFTRNDLCAAVVYGVFAQLLTELNSLPIGIGARQNYAKAQMREKVTYIKGKIHAKWQPFSPSFSFIVLFIWVAVTLAITCKQMNRNLNTAWANERAEQSRGRPPSRDFSTPIRYCWVLNIMPWHDGRHQTKNRFVY